MDKELLKESFKKHKIFDFFWNDSIIDCFDDDILLDFIPQEYVGYYQKVFELPLFRVNGNSGDFAGIHSNITIKLTSITGDLFDVDKAIREIDNSGVESAILIIVKMLDDKNSVMFITQFNLGSSEAEKIETTSKHIEQISVFY